jgi:hypothetical protein
MAISDTQKVDYLWKKIGYAATKTDTTANKDATNEALPSPLQIRGDSLLVQSSSIPSSIPATTTSIVTVYRPDATLEMPQTAIGTNGPGQRGQLGSATAYRTWQTGSQNWISPEFGATYSVRVFLDNAGRTTSNTTGTELFATASGEEWFFDYQSGVLNFSGTNLPSGISTKSVYISGARYTGEIGIANTVNTAAAAFAHANAAFAAANTGASSAAAFNQANSAFFHANAAFTAANNATDTYVRNHANAAFDAANAATATNTTQNNSIASAFVHANAAFANANSYITYNEAVSVTQNNSIASAFVHANAAFTAANNATDTFVRNHANAAFDTANGAVAVNTTQNNSITVALDTANAAFSNANSYITYNEAVSVTQNNSITAAFAAANAATATDVTQNNSIASAFIHANAAFANANSYITYNEAVSVTQNNSITAAFTRANNSLDANTGGTVTGQVIITGNLIVTGTTTYANTVNQLIADSIITLNADLPQDGYPSENSGFEVERGLLPNSSILWIEAASKWSANNGNTSYYLAAEDRVDAAFNAANASFASANNIDGINTTQNNSIASAFIHANAAFIRANNSLNANTGGNVTGEVVIVGNLTSNSLTTTGSNGSITGANAIFSNYVYAANGAVDLYIYTTRAFDAANAAFANANSYITYNEAVSVTQNNSITAAFAAANAATATDVTQNNSIVSAFVHANAAFASANNIDGVNVTQNNSIASAFVHANAVFANANSYITYNEAVSVTQNNSIVAAFNTGNSAFFHANAVFANANSYITYNEAVSVTQNNSIAASFVHANAAFVRANNSLDANNGGQVTGNISVGGTITPNADVTYNLGSPSNRWHSLFVGAGTIDIGGLTISNVTVNSLTTARIGGVQDIQVSDAAVGSFRQIAYQANSAFIRANNSLDANNGGAVTGNVNVTGNVYAGNVVANTGFTSAAGLSRLQLTDIGLVALQVAGQEFKFGGSGIESSPGIFGGSFGGNRLSLNNETNLRSDRYDVVKIQTGTDGTTPNEFVFSNNSLTVPGGITANGFTAGGINVVPTLVSSFSTANAAFANSNTYITYAEAVSVTQNNSITAAFAAANAATATDTTQNNSITAAFVRANNSLDANNGGTISGDIVITGNLTANIVGGTF